LILALGPFLFCIKLHATLKEFLMLLATRFTPFKKLSAVSALSFFVTLTPHLSAQITGDAPPQPKISVQSDSTGFSATVNAEKIHLTVCSDTVFHVVATPTAAASQAKHPWILADSCPGAPFTFKMDQETASISTAALKLTFSLKSGNFSYATVDGASLLREGDAEPRAYEPVTLNGQPTYHLTDRFSPVATEGFYGLGQHQSGLFNYRGATVELAQNNTDVAIPLLLSSKGYGILWNSASASQVDNRFPLEVKFNSLAGDAIDYYFFYGPSFDQILHQYRSLTGHAPMLPKWGYGLFQSKDRYVSQKEILDVAAGYRSRHIPIDAIVQDWFWWKTEGDPIFNENFTDIPAELKTLHDEHIHAMISVWGLFDNHSENYKTLAAKHWDVPGAHVYDATNPEARDFYWKNLPGKLFALGWDAFWLDSAEPEEYYPHYGDAILKSKKLAMGNGAEYTNIFPFLHSSGVQDHWRADSSDKRTFLLTRSAFIGQQRVGATVWSGDVYSTFWGLTHQVPAGLNFALSGYPYWTTDIGGYWPPSGSVFADPDYPELYARWFEYGVFCPIFRTHGHREANEMWAFPKVESTLLAYDKLRYRLMPYIYSLAWRVHHDDYTIQRPLVMDWREDPAVRSTFDEFTFGPSLLVAPVLNPGVSQREVYLPASARWYDFWTGQPQVASTRISAPAPLDRLPLYVPAGSILPLGPEVEYAAEHPEGPIELRIYTGADGSFTLYDDEGDNYNYEKGQHALIPIQWSESNGTLTIGAREGSYPGMPASIRFNIVWVRPNHGAGAQPEANPDRSITYTGAAVTLRRD